MCNEKMSFIKSLKMLGQAIVCHLMISCIAPGVFAATATADKGQSSALVKTADGRLVVPEIARIIDRGELIVAVLEKDTPPFVYVSNGELVGADIDIVRRVAAALQVSVRFDRTAKTYDEIVLRVAQGHADLGVSKLARTLKRSQSVLFSTPYLLLDHALLVNRLAFADMAKERKATKAVRNFTGKMGVLEGSAWAEFAKRSFPKAEIVPFKTWKMAVEAVTKGAVVAAYRDAIEVRTIMKADPALSLTLRTVTFTDLYSVLCVMIGPNNHMLQSFVNEVIANQPEKLTLNYLLTVN